MYTNRRVVGFERHAFYFYSQNPFEKKHSKMFIRFCVSYCNARHNFKLGKRITILSIHNINILEPTFVIPLKEKRQYKEFS